MKHTEGLTYGWNHDWKTYVISVEGGPDDGTIVGSAEFLADARLWSKAPEMAALLRELNEHFDSFFGIPTRLYVERTKSLLAELEEHE